MKANYNLGWKQSSLSLSPEYTEYRKASLPLIIATYAVIIAALFIGGLAI